MARALISNPLRPHARRCAPRCKHGGATTKTTSSSSNSNRKPHLISAQLTSSHLESACVRAPLATRLDSARLCGDREIGVSRREVAVADASELELDGRGLETRRESRLVCAVLYCILSELAIEISRTSRLSRHAVVRVRVRVSVRTDDEWR